MGKAALTVGSVLIDSWTKVSVSKSLSQICDTFTLEIRMDRAGRLPGGVKDITEGDACKINLVGLNAITGVVDTVSRMYDTTSRGFRVAGRSRTGQIVDCSAAYKTGGWKNASIETIAKNLCAPFGINVIVNVSGDKLAKFNKFRIEQNETVSSCILRAARMRGVILNTSPSGDLILDSPETSDAPYALTKDNILECSSERSIRERFSEIAVVGSYSGSDVFHGEQSAKPIGRFVDPNIKLYRPHIMISHQQGTPGDLESMAFYEGNRRAAQAQSVTYKVNGFGSRTLLWGVNQVVSVTDHDNDITESMLVESVTHSIEPDSGDTTSIGVTRLGAYTTEPIPEKERGKWAS